MTFNNLSASRQRWVRAAAIMAVGAAALGATGVAQANNNVFWSVGVAAPGVQVGVANGPQYYPQVAPVYVQPAPVYYQPAPVYVQPAPVYYRPAPVYYRPAPAYYRTVAWNQPGYRYAYGEPGRHNGHGRDHDGRGDERGDHRR
jgi:hypothetical protein